MCLGRLIMSVVSGEEQEMFKDDEFDSLIGWLAGRSFARVLYTAPGHFDLRQLFLKLGLFILLYFWRSQALKK